MDGTETETAHKCVGSKSIEEGEKLPYDVFDLLKTPRQTPPSQPVQDPPNRTRLIPPHPMEPDFNWKARPVCSKKKSPIEPLKGIQHLP